MSRARHLVLVIGPTTHQSIWIKKEVQHAIQEGVSVIPVLVGGVLKHWIDFDLTALQAVSYKRGQWRRLVGEVLRVTKRISAILLSPWLLLVKVLLKVSLLTRE